MTLVISLFLGALTWSFAEYAIHNWVGHLTKGKTAFSREHLAHHRDGRYFAPARRKVGFALPVVLVVSAVAVLAAGWLGLAYAGSFVATYIAYEVLHRRSHTHAPIGPYGRWVRRHHLYHHFGSPKTNHGVTSPLWDLVFRTYRAPGRIRVPEKQLPSVPWLVDSTGEVKPELARDYVIARKRRRAAA